jgi:pimeloyl-ACP methyl ester carboxylesterase
MTLNASIFPELSMPRVEVDFTTLALSQDGALPAPPRPGGGMEVYRGLLDDLLVNTPSWAARRRIVVAHSFGGMLALWWLLAHRGGRQPGVGRAHANGELGRIDGLVLIGTTAGPMLDAVKLRLARIWGWDWRIGINGPMRLWNRPVVTRTVKRVLNRGSLEARKVDFKSIKHPTDLALDFAGWRNTDWRAMRSFRFAMMGFDVRDRLGEITVPTIVLHGADDALFLPEVGRSLARDLPSAEFRLIPGAGHGLPLTHGEAVVEAVGDILEEA